MPTSLKYPHIITSCYRKLTRSNHISNLTIIMFGKLLISNFITSAVKADTQQQKEEEAVSLAKMFLQYVKSLKKTGVKLRESLLLNENGSVSVRDSSVVTILTEQDIEVSKLSILLPGKPLET